MNAITEALIEQAVSLLAAAAPRATVILFGSCARRDANSASDADFLVVEPELTARREEMVRLRDALRPLRIPVDVIAVSRADFDRWRSIPGTLIYEAAREGKVCYAA